MHLKSSGHRFWHDKSEAEPMFLCYAIILARILTATPFALAPAIGY